jgi:predicted GNAT superfamily acetyltransferase
VPNNELNRMNTRPIVPADFADVLALNEESVRYLSPLSLSQLATLHEQSAFHRIVEKEGLVIAFILAFREGADYASVNYRWFARRYKHFLYIDRVVVSRHIQSKGAGTILYREVFRHADEHQIPIVTCEFDVEPPNPISERFHAGFGFAEVGRQSILDGKKVVSLQRARASSDNAAWGHDRETLSGRFGRR